MKRIALNTLTAVCVLCCIAILVLRSASFHGQIVAACDHEDGTRTILWNEGGNVLVQPKFHKLPDFDWPMSETRKPFRWRQLSLNARWYTDPLQMEEWFELYLPQRSFAGFGIETRSSIFDSAGRANPLIELASVPHWFLLIPFAVLPGIRAMRWLRNACDRFEWLKRSVSYGVIGVSTVSALCVFTLLGLWIRSHSVGDQLSFLNGSNTRWTILESGKGGLGYFSNTLMPIEIFNGNRMLPLREFYVRRTPPRYPDDMYPYSYAGYRARPASVHGFVFSDAYVKGWGLRQVTVPIWSLVCVAGAATLPGIIQSRSRLRSTRSARRGLCSHCGYDLRATPDRCPECGFVTERIIEPPMGHG